MRFRCAQRMVGNIAVYDFFNVNGDLLCHAAVSLSTKGKCDIEAKFSSEKVLMLSFAPELRVETTPVDMEVPFSVSLNGQTVGSFWSTKKQTGRFSFQAYPYYPLELDGQNFVMYAIQIPGKGLFLQLMKDDVTVAMIGKAVVTRSEENLYYLVTSDYEHFPLAAAAMLYFDIAIFSDVLMNNKRASIMASACTGHKDLVAKFDDDFWHQTSTSRRPEGAQK